MGYQKFVLSAIIATAIPLTNLFAGEQFRSSRRKTSNPEASAPKKSATRNTGAAKKVSPWSKWDVPIEELRVFPDNVCAFNPTAGSVRTENMDAWGSGEYLARRNDPDKRGLSVHEGVDYIGDVGAEVVAPVGGLLRRYGEGANTGAVLIGLIQGVKHKIKLLHFTVDAEDGPVSQGQVIGKVKDLGRYYPGMLSHVHMEVHEWRSFFGYRAKDPGLIVQSQTALVDKPAESQ